MSERRFSNAITITTMMVLRGRVCYDDVYHFHCFHTNYDINKRALSS